MLVGNFLTAKKSKAEYRRLALDNWAWIRLLLSDINVTYSEVIKMNHDDVYMLNAALDIAQEQNDKQANKKK